MASTSGVVVFNPVYAQGRQDFTTTVFADGMTIARTNSGRYTVTLNTLHPNGTDYAVFLTGVEGANRDNPKVVEVDGTRTASGFDLMVTTDDNGGAADVYVDDEFSVIVFRTA